MPILKKTSAGWNKRNTVKRPFPYTLVSVPAFRLTNNDKASMLLS